MVAALLRESHESLHFPDDLGRQSLAWWEQKLGSLGFRREQEVGRRDRGSGKLC